MKRVIIGSKLVIDEIIIGDYSSSLNILCSENLADPQRDILSMSDADIASLNRGDIDDVIDPVLLDRIRQINKHALNLDQVAILKEYYKNKVRFGPDDIAEVLSAIQNCRKVKLVPRRDNKEFCKKYRLTDADLLRILKQLTPEDFVFGSRSKNYKFLGHSIVIFKDNHVELPSGATTDVPVYIKLDISCKDSSVIAAISFHESKDELDAFASSSDEY